MPSAARSALTALRRARSSADKAGLAALVQARVAGAVGDGAATGGFALVVAGVPPGPSSFNANAG